MIQHHGRDSENSDQPGNLDKLCTCTTVSLATATATDPRRTNRLLHCCMAGPTISIIPRKHTKHLACHNAINTHLLTSSALITAQPTKYEASYTWEHAGRRSLWEDEKVNGRTQEDKGGHGRTWGDIGGPWEDMGGHERSIQSNKPNCRPNRPPKLPTNK